MKHTIIFIKVRLLVVLLGCVGSTLLMAMDWNLDYLQDKSSEGILEHSWSVSFEQDEKTYLRSYLAAMYPDTAEGLFSQGYLAYKNEDHDAAKRYLKECINRFPENNYCPYLLGDLFIDEIAYLKVVIDRNPEFSLYSAVDRYIYSVAKANSMEAALIEAAKIREKIGDNYAIEYGLGKGYWWRNEHEKALFHLKNAIELPNKRLDLYFDLANFEADFNTEDLETKLRYYLDRLNDYLSSNVLSAEATARFASAISKIGLPTPYSHNLFQISWAQTPNSIAGEALLSYWARTEMPDKAEKVTATVAANPYRFASLLDNTFALQQDQLAQTTDSIARLLNYQSTKDQYLHSAMEILAFLEATAQFQYALMVADEALGHYPQATKFRNKKVALLVSAGKHQELIAELKKPEYADQLNRQHIINKAELAILEDEEAQSASALHPFLHQWNQAFDNKLVLDIEFTPGSAVVPPPAHKLLAEAASLLLQPNAQDYLLLLQGHQDKQTGNSKNEELPEQRAQAIKDYLVQSHQVPEHRLKILRDAERQTNASIWQPDALPANRSASLTLYDRFSSPRIVTSSQLEPKNKLEISPDGQIAAIGTNPVVLWDLHSLTRLKTLGHGSEYRFSPNGRYLADISNGDYSSNEDMSADLTIYDVNTGRVFHSMKLAGVTLNDLAWSPQSDEIAMSNTTGRLLIYTLAEKSITRTTKTGNAAAGALIAWSKDNRLYIAQHNTKQVVVKDSFTFSKITTLKGTASPKVLKLSPDGSTLIMVDKLRLLTRWDIPSYTRQADFVTAVPTQITFHPSQPIVILNTDKWPYTHEVYSYKDLQSIHNWSEENQSQYAFIADGQKLLQTSENRIVLRNTLDYAIESTTSKKSAPPVDLHVLENSGYALVQYESALHLWDITTAQRKQVWSMPLQPLGIAERNKYWAIDRQSGKLYKIDLVDFSLKQVFDFGQPIKAVSIDQQWLALGFGGSESDDTNTKVEDEGAIILIDMANKSMVAQRKIKFLDSSRDNFDIYRTGFSNFKLDMKNDSLIYSTRWQDGWGQPLSYSQKAVVLDTKSLEIVYTLNNEDEIKILTTEGSQVQLQGKEYSRRFDLSSGKLLETNKPSGEQVISRRADNNANQTVVTDYYRYIKLHSGTEEIFLPLKDKLVTARVSASQNLLIALFKTGELALYNLTDLQQVVTLRPKDDKEWIAYTQTGYFTASKNGSTDAWWNLADRVLPLTPLRKNFNNPDVIQRQLSAISTKNTQKLKELQQPVDLSTAL